MIPYALGIFTISLVLCLLLLLRLLAKVVESFFMSVFGIQKRRNKR